jgi:glycosyltransferase involved in cell wall biosynthesis
MRIGIDATPFALAMDGISRSVREIAMQLQKLDRDNDYYLYSRVDFDFPIENPRWHKCLHPRVPHLLGNFYLGKASNHGRGAQALDVFWAGRVCAFPFGLSPAVGRVITIHDLVWLLYPKTMRVVNRVLHLLLAEKGIEQADRIIAVSESTRRGLVERLGVAPEKVAVVHHGVAERFAPCDPAQSAQFIAEKYGTSRNYVCAVGTVEPRKNIVALIEAVKILRDRGQLHHQLLIAGGAGWRTSDIYAKVERCRLTEREVKFLGRVTEEDLPLLYSGATVFVFPSLYEGFGLPIVEAMACGAPVVASNTSSVPEVVQDAGILVPPNRPEEFAQAILRVTSDQRLHAQLTEKGLQRARAFRWELAATKILTTIIEAGRSRRRLEAPLRDLL